MSNSRNRTTENGGTFPAEMYALLTGRVCPVCEAAMVTELDHITPWEHGGDNSESNCGPMCGSCHFTKTRAVQLGLPGLDYQGLHFQNGVRTRVENPDWDRIRIHHAAKMAARVHTNKGNDTAAKRHQKIAYDAKRETIAARPAGHHSHLENELRDRVNERTWGSTPDIG